MRDVRPGLRPDRLAMLMRRAVTAMSLDLQGATVVTEAATGAYAVTPVLAALGGASKVTAATRSTRFGSIDDAIRETMVLADLVGVAERIEITDGLSTDQIGAADIVTNSGHVRPIDAAMISGMRSGCVVPLMFEAWEIDLGRDDVDLPALRNHGIRYAGTNERQPAVDVFSYLGPMLLKLLNDAAVAGFDSRILLACDNPFAPYLVDGLTRVGAKVIARDALHTDDLTDDLDAVAIALSPRGSNVVSNADLAAIAQRSPGAVLGQFWGDISREACMAAGVPCVPTDDPGVGHMGILPSAVGPEPIVRLQAGGLKVASILRRPEHTWSADDREYVDEC